MTIFILAVALALPQAAEEKRPIPALEEALRFTDKDVVGFDFAPAGGLLGIGGTGCVSTLDLKTLKIVKQSAQRDLVDEVVFDPEGKLLITRSKGPDTVVRVASDLETLKFAIDVPASAYRQQIDEEPPTRRSCPAAFSADGKRLALVSGSRGFRVWGLERLGGKQSVVYELGFEMIPLSGRPNSDPEDPHMLLAHGTAIAFNGPRLWMGMEEGYVLPVDPALLKPLDEPNRSTDVPPVGAPQPPDVARVTRRQYRSLKQAQAFRPHDGDVTSILFLKGDRHVLTAGMDGKIKVWTTQEILDRKPPAVRSDKFREPQPVRTLSGHFACLSKDGRFVAVAESGGIRCYDSETWAIVSWTPTESKLGTPARVKFSPDGSLLAATVCQCPTCLKRDVIYTTGQPKMRSHHHGGALIVWNTRPGESGSPGNR